jgi:hypothetical protein
MGSESATSSGKNVKINVTVAYARLLKIRSLVSLQWNADIFYSPKLGQRWVALANKQTGFKKIMRFSAEVSLLSIEGLLETEFSVTERKRPLH